MRIIIAAIFFAFLSLPTAYGYELSGEVSISKPQKPVDNATIHIDGDTFAGKNKNNNNQIIIKNGLIYVIDSSKGIAYTYHVKNSDEKGVKSFLGVNIPEDINEYMKLKKAVKTGTEKVLGHDCDVYTYTEGKKEIKKTYTIYIKQGTNIPLRTLIKSDYYGDARYEFTSITLAKPDSKAFELPANMQIVPKD
jgi:outer membrane lipoprotein-sorting protein